MICPKCKVEYQKGFSMCTDCDVELIKEQNEVVINGKTLTCPVCAGKSFKSRSSLLNSRKLTILGMDWADQGATNYICDECRYIFWFAKDD